MDAQHLVAGDRLLNSDESWSEVVSVAAVEKPIKAYNLTVANNHTYFIAGAAPAVANDNSPQNPLAAKAVWVHNDCNLDDLADGWKKLDDNTVIGVYGTKYEIQSDGTLLNVGSATDSEISAAGVQIQTNPSNLIGEDFEIYLHNTLQNGRVMGQEEAVINGKKISRDFDASYINNGQEIWVEAKSGGFWDHESNINKFKSNLGQQQQIAEANGVGFEVHSSTPIPKSVKDWLIRRNIDFKEW